MSWPAATLNLAVAMALLVGVGTVFDLLIRGAASRLQVSLTSILVVIFAVAVMLGERYADWNMYAIAEWPNQHPTLLAEYPWYCSVPIYFGSPRMG